MPIKHVILLYNDNDNNNNNNKKKANDNKNNKKHWVLPLQINLPNLPTKITIGTNRVERVN